MNILKEASQIKNKLINHRRTIHTSPEVHLDLPITSDYVFNELLKLGYSPQRLGSSGIVAIAGNKPGNTIMLRADMDALPIEEETNLEFKSENQCMHACGHDMHTAMLLGAAEILKNREEDLNGKVKMIFQPGEETFSGAKMMIKEGVLENPKVDAAMTLHVAVGLPIPVGTIIFTDDNDSYAAADWFEINITGKGCHGAMPHTGVDPINIGVQIYLALQEIVAREVAPSDTVIITLGEFKAGNISNAIPGNASLKGTIRTLDNQTRSFVKRRVQELSESIAKAYNGQATVTYSRDVPAMTTCLALNNSVKKYTDDLLGSNYIISSKDFTKHQSNSEKCLASEDFTLYSENVSSIALAIAAGQPADGFIYPPHHPKVNFDENALTYGAAVFANSAIRYLEDN